MDVVKDKVQTCGTIAVMAEKIPTEIRCPYNCDGGNACVSTKTGTCHVCGRTFKINATKLGVD